MESLSTSKIKFKTSKKQFKNSLKDLWVGEKGTYPEKCPNYEFCNNQTTHGLNFEFCSKDCKIYSQVDFESETLYDDLFETLKDNFNHQVGNK